MLKYIEQDLLKVKSPGVIVHQINSVGVIGGLNKAICTKFPANRSVILDNRFVELGTVLLVETQGSIIANCISQKYPGSPVDAADSYKERRYALRLCLNELADAGHSDLYVPYKLASGMAGDSWSVIEQLLADFAAETNTIVTVCKPKWAI